MNAISKSYITGITTIIAAFLVVMSAVGLAFAEEALDATVQITPATAPETALETAPGTTPEIAPETTPEGTPRASMLFGLGQKTPLVTRIAFILNMKVEDLIAARHEGKSFTQIAEGKGVSEKELLDALTEDMKAFLDVQVAQGKLTPEQSAAMLSKMEENLSTALNRTEIGPPETRPNAGGAIGQNIGRNTGRDNVSRMHRAHGRATTGKHGAMRGFTREVQAGQRQGLGFGPGCGMGQGPGQGPGQAQSQDQGQGKGQCQGTCPYCGRALGSTEPAN